MRSLVLFMHLSLDGFVAGPGGELDWITVNEEIFDFAEQRTQAATTALYGRVTWQMMEAYWPTAAEGPNPTRHELTHSRWYNQVEKVVLSRTLQSPRKGEGPAPRRTRIIGGDLQQEIGRLKSAPGGEIVIFGSPGAAHSLLALGLVDELWLFVNPILLGQGIPLFRPPTRRTGLALVSSHPFASGVVCLHYRVV
jgi:dihydrofolate reductase